MMPSDVGRPSGAIIAHRAFEHFSASDVRSLIGIGGGAVTGIAAVIGAVAGIGVIAGIDSSDGSDAIVNDRP